MLNFSDKNGKGDPQKVVSLSSKRRLYSLIIDEFFYRVVIWIQKRSQKKLHALPPLCCLNSDLISHRLIATGTYESTNLEALSELLSEKWNIIRPDQEKDGIFIDIGANIGVYSIFLADYFSRVLAVEANPISYRLLEANITLTGCSNIDPINVAASDKNGNLSLRTAPEGNLGWASIVPDPRPLSDPGVTQVAAQRIDEIIGDKSIYRRVSLIKVDVEGHELMALMGAEDTIRRDKPVILFESNGSDDAHRVFEFLETLNYKNFALFRRDKSKVNIFSNCKVSLVQINPNLAQTVSLVCAY